MIVKLLTVFLFISVTAGDETLPAEQLQIFIRNVVNNARQSGRVEKTLQDVNYVVRDVLFGIPIELALVTRNTTFQGPTSMEVVTPVKGTQLPSGTAIVKTNIRLDSLTLRYDYVLLDLFGMAYNGSMEFTMFEPTANLTIHVYRNVLTSCEVTASLTDPKGAVVVSLGEGNGILRVLMLAVQYLVPFVSNFTPGISEWLLFPNVNVHLANILTDAARKTACP